MNQYKHEAIIDYALPTMRAEKALKQLHQEALNRNYDAAINYALEAASYCREAGFVLLKMAEEEKKRDKAIVV